MAKRVCPSTSSDWARLPDGLLDSILEKLVPISHDYLRFSAVCKSWNSMALNHKQKHMLQKPWLLTSSWDDDCNERFMSLYSFTTPKICNFLFHIPHKRCYGSSHGWLILMGIERLLIVFNPVSGAAIRLPPLINTTEFSLLRKVVLSNDPSLGSFEVLASFSESNVFAYLKYGDKIWTYSKKTSFDIVSFTFYKDRVLGVSNSGGRIVSLHISVGHDDNIGSSKKSSSSHIKIEEIAPQLNDKIFLDSFLVEITNGDVLAVHRCESRSRSKGYEIYYEIYKLVDSNGKFERISVLDLSGHCLLLGKNNPIPVLASNHPGFKPNSIYYSCASSTIQKNSGFIIDAYGIEEFNMKDRNVHVDRSITTCCREDWVPPSMFWIFPTMLNAQTS